jgi:hypothetical protein
MKGTAESGVSLLCSILLFGSQERYLIEVQTRNTASGQRRVEEEIQEIAKEALTLVIGEGHDDVVRGLKPNPISESHAQRLTKVQELLTRPDSAIYLVE